ncbi:MAG TPA: DNRLRE domain-containing protein [Phycisphaerales bacterium]|nr:DNRLRE domain-containing protein [Phycisphaerales bacterium]
MKICALAAVVSAGLAASALADTAALSANHDNSIFSELPTHSNGSGTGLFVGNTLQGGTRRALISFDLSSIPANATITGASVTLNMVQTAGGAINIGLHRVTTGWGEGASAGSGQGAPAQPGEATWTHAEFGIAGWGSAGGDFVAGASSSKSVGSSGAYTWSSSVAMVADVQGWLNDPSSNFGWMLIGDAVNGTAKRFASREFSDNELLQPVLNVEYTVVPAPASVALLGVAGLALRRRR